VRCGGGNDPFLRQLAPDLDSGTCDCYAWNRSCVVAGLGLHSVCYRCTRALAYFLLGLFDGVYTAHSGLDKPFLAGGSYERVVAAPDRCHPRSAGLVVPASQGRSFRSSWFVKYPLDALLLVANAYVDLLAEARVR
jgi:hypothetical protein